MINGINYSWSIVDEIGSGDAGEVLLVKREGNLKPAVLKRPVQKATGGTIVRQSLQIQTEGEILEKLSGLNLKMTSIYVSTPMLLDKSPVEKSNTAAYFIISEQVEGLPLNEYAHNRETLMYTLRVEELLQILSALFMALTAIHKKDILWNDVKTEHIYWNREASTISLIDWGNSRLLSEQSNSNILVLSEVNDYHQMIREMRSFLSIVNPDLLLELDWPMNDMQSITLNDIDRLEKRIAYLTSYVDAKAVTVRSSLEQRLANLTTTEDLQIALKLFDQSQDKKKPFDSQLIFSAVEKWILRLSKDKDFPACFEVIDTLTKNKYLQLNFQWDFLNKLLRLIGNNTNKDVDEVINHIFERDWSAVNWWLSTTKIFEDEPNAVSMLQYFIRKHVLPKYASNIILKDQLRDLSDEVHAKIVKQRLEQNEDGSVEHLLENSSRLDYLIKNWGEDREEDFFGSQIYALNQVIGTIQDLGIMLSMEINLFLSSLIDQTKDFFKYWNAGNHIQGVTILKDLLLWDPNNKGILSIERQVISIKMWINSLIIGPDQKEDAEEFLQKKASSFPKIFGGLGMPSWLKPYSDLVEAIKNGQDNVFIAEMLKNEQLLFSWVDQKLRKKENGKICTGL